MTATDFSRTLQTAADAESITLLLTRASEWVKGKSGHDHHRLVELARRYRDYAVALRETVSTDAPEPADDQAVLL